MAIEKSPALANIMAHFDSLAGRQQEVPEWGDDRGPLVIYHDPVTVADRNRWYPFTRRGNTEFYVEVLIDKAKTETGEPLFTKADRHFLCTRADYNVVERVVNRIVGLAEAPDLGES